jgi:hypothetical protein
MSRGPLFVIARRSATSMIRALLILNLVCAGILGLSYRFFYNWWTGPVPFTAALAERPGLHRWVHAEGPALPTGLQRISTTRLMKGLIKSSRVSASYSAMLVGGKPLIVISEDEMHGTQILDGAIEPLPEDVRSHLGIEGVHPWLLDTRTGYRIWNANLSVWIVLPLLGLGVLGLVLQVPVCLRPMKGVLEKASRYGDAVSIVGQVDGELRSAGLGGTTGEVWLTRSWLVGKEPTCTVVRLDDQVAIGFKADTNGRIEITCWERGRADAVTIRVPEAEGRRVLERLTQTLPCLVVTDVAAFEARWKADRLGCEAVADAAAAAARTTGAPAVRAAAAVPAVPPALPARSA